MSDYMDDYDVEDDNVDYQAPGTMSLNQKDALIRDAAERIAAQSTKAARVTKPRAPPFGPNTLLGPKGFRKLRQLFSDFEHTDNTLCDLDKVIKIYHEWTHSMYPKFQFRDVINKIERHCRTTSMKAYLVALRRAREEGKGFDEVEFVAERDTADAMAALDMDAIEGNKQEDDLA